MRKTNTKAKFSILGYLFFLLPIMLTVGFSVVIYDLMAKKGMQIIYIALFIMLYIMFAALLFTLCDVIRRRLMENRPVEQILEATEKIASGDFKTKLIPMHSYYKYTEYDIIMENINKMTAELSKSEILKTEFISNVSHEIKTPLSVIQNYAKALQNPKLEEKTKKKYLEIIVSASKRLSNLVTNILKLNKLENQNLSIDKQNINVGELLRDCILQYEDLLEEKNISLTCEIKDIQAHADASFIELIFNNLISNAIKFSNNSGKIKITLNSQGENVIFSVKDTGCGISKDIGERIFDKFYQGDTSHSSEGNGLGLALVRKVIDIIGGEIVVQSQENKGSLFTVKFKRK